MKTIAGVAAVCVSILAFSSAVQAEDLQKDPLFQGRTIEYSFGLFAPMNTLQDTLTTRNGGGAQTKSTNALNFGTGARISLTYSNPVSPDARLVLSMTGATAAGETRLRIGPLAETFPGSYDDGFSLPANWNVDTEIETRTTMLTVGREWAANDSWRFSAGLQGGTASQDLTGLLRAIPPFAIEEDELWRTITSRSKNTMVGVYGGVSHYMPLGDSMGLRLSGNVGVMRNSFNYEYTQVINAVGFPPSNQNIVASDSRMAFSTKLSARLERTMADGTLVSLEVGYDGLHGVGNGADTLLDVDGRTDFADIEGDSIGAGYLSLGYAFKF